MPSAHGGRPRHRCRAAQSAWRWAGIKPFKAYDAAINEQGAWQEVGMKEVRDVVAGLDASEPAQASVPEPVDPALNLRPFPPCWHRWCREQGCTCEVHVLYLFWCSLSQSKAS